MTEGERMVWAAAFALELWDSCDPRRAMGHAEAAVKDLRAVVLDHGKPLPGERQSLTMAREMVEALDDR